MSTTILLYFKTKDVHYMPDNKNIYASISDHVQMVGYREAVEVIGKYKGLSGFVFNDVDGSVKVMANGPALLIDEFVEELGTVRPGTTIEVSEIVEDIKLPSPFGRIATDDIMEYMARFDKGIAILSEHTAILKQNTSLLYETNKRLEILDKVDEKLGGMDDKLTGMDDKLGGMNESLYKVNDKLDTLPERIAEALKR